MNIINPHCYYKIVDVKAKTYRQRGAFNRACNIGNLRTYYAHFGKYYKQ